MSDMIEWAIFIFITALAGGFGWHCGSTLVARYFWPANARLSYEMEMQAGETEEVEEE